LVTRALDLLHRTSEIRKPIRLLFRDKAHTPGQGLTPVLHDARLHEPIEDRPFPDSQTCHDGDGKVGEQLARVSHSDGPRDVPAELALCFRRDSHALLAGVLAVLLDPAAARGCKVDSLGRSDILDPADDQDFVAISQYVW